MEEGIISVKLEDEKSEKLRNESLKEVHLLSEKIISVKVSGITYLLHVFST